MPLKVSWPRLKPLWQRLAEMPSPAPARKTTRTSARNRKGELKGDTPATSEVNEAFVDD